MLNIETPLDTNTTKWPYPVHYGKKNEIDADVLIIGGGIAGSHAAITAAKRGAKTVVIDKGPVIRSGNGGSGVDHWHCACTNPCSKVTPEEMVETILEARGHITPSEYGIGAAFYILCKESYDALLDIEKMGVKIRDEDDEFIGAEFRDETTRFLFAYDYENRTIMRVQAALVKPALYKELNRQNVEIHDYVMATSLLTEGGEPGARVVGATGLHVRTGEFFVIHAKASIVCSGPSNRLWVFSTELAGANSAHDDPNCTGDGNAMAWRAGAEFTLMEASSSSAGGFRYPAYGTGNAHNTWFACTIVDSNGKEVPWVDRDGKVLKTVSDRYRLAPGQRLFYHGPPPLPYEIQGPRLIPDLSGRIEKGEFVLPFYADLPSMPANERRAIFGLMTAHEGKTRIPIYELYTQAGFDPDKDMLQANILPPGLAGSHMPWWNAVGPPQWREMAFGGGGGLVYDWDLQTTLKGLYAAGNQLAGGGNHAGAAATGRYAGRKAADDALITSRPRADRSQVEKEMARVYAPVNQTGGIGWKELQAGLCRIMQDYCGEYKGEKTLQAGLEWLNGIRESEAASAYARNPHELARTLECFSRLRVGEMIMNASLARKESNSALDFKRLDYPAMDNPEWDKFVTIRLEKGEVKTGELPSNYWLLPPYSSTYEENYEIHCGI